MLLALWANPIVRKVALYGIVVVFALYLFRIWGNQQWYKGEQQGRVSATVELEEQYRADWETKQKEIEAFSTQVKIDRKSLDAEKELLRQSRSGLMSSLQSTLSKIESARYANETNVVAIPADELDAALRSLSAELAAAQ
jgi:hypothetical protein